MLPHSRIDINHFGNVFRKNLKLMLDFIRICSIIRA
jgi:hypothetical protein